MPALFEIPASFATWCLVIGAVLMLIGLSDTVRRSLPVSTSAFYLAAGWLLGPQVFALIELDIEADARLIERMTEIAVLVSLFGVGLRLRVRPSDRLWLPPLTMATVTMFVTVALMVGVGLAAGLALGWAVLLAAILAPTDPVLASEVQVDDTRDRDRLRVCLSGEGGLNDGTAFPFVMLALGLLGAHELGRAGWRWWAVDVAWASAAGSALGWALGWGFGKAVVHLRHRREQAFGMEGFLTLGLIALTYGLALEIQSYGFLAVFAAGLAMRHVEHQHNEDPEDVPSSGEEAAASPAKSSAYMAKAALDFTLDLEKLGELAVMLIVGSLLSAASFTPTSIGVAAALIFLVRPLAVWATTRGIALDRTQRRLAGWFGIRGIGSLYYLSFAIAHGADDAPSADRRLVIDAVLTTIALSVLLHGSSAKPFMELYRRARGER